MIAKELSFVRIALENMNICHAHFLDPPADHVSQKDLREPDIPRMI